MNIKYRTLNAVEAQSIIERVAAGEDFDGLPFATLNAAGKRAVDDFVREYARDGEPLNMTPWYSEAERAANDAGIGGPIIFEVGSLVTADRSPHTLTLAASDFDLEIME